MVADELLRELDGHDSNSMFAARRLMQAAL
jgi:hypothetical protein